ncbi:MAG: hypothetical protein ACPHCZ_01550 [Candidatus Poseidoniaceae archaeon]
MRNLEGAQCDEGVGFTMGRRRRKAAAAEAPAAPPLPDLPPLPALDGAAPAPLPELPALPDLPPAAPLPDLPAPAPAAAPPESGSNEADAYSEMWAKRTEKPLQQVYGHIDRLTNKEAGSLLDRYADRFGHELDREIIVLRKQMHDDRLAEVRDAPTVELLDAEPVVDDQTVDRLTTVENRLRELKPLYEAAKASGDTESLDALRPELKALMEERRSLRGTPAAPAPAPAPAAAVAQPVADEFPPFVTVVDNLLGTDLPEDAVQAFLAGPDFALYERVGLNPAGASHEDRVAFFAMVDALLGDMPEDAISAFVASPNFALYSRIGATYS